MASKEQVPLSFRIVELIEPHGYRVGAVATDEHARYKTSIRTLAVWTKAFFIFKPVPGWKGWFAEPPCIAMLNAVGKDWYVQIYGKEYQDEMEVIAALLAKEFKVQTYSKVLRDTPRNY